MFNLMPEIMNVKRPERLVYRGLRVGQSVRGLRTLSLPWDPPPSSWVHYSIHRSFSTTEFFVKNLPNHIFTLLWILQCVFAIISEPSVRRSTLDLLPSMYTGTLPSHRGPLNKWAGRYTGPWDWPRILGYVLPHMSATVTLFLII